MTLHRLMFIHALATGAAAVVLVVSPTWIPATVDIQIDRSAYLLRYFLGATELALAFLSLQSRQLTDPAALRLVVTTFIVFHGSTALVELYALAQQASPRLWANLVVRVVVVMAFWLLGIRRHTPSSA